MSATTQNNILYLAGIEGESIVDGPGIRFAIFCQGCPHGCEGCHNPETHPFEGGTPVRIEKILEVIDKDPLLRGVTFSGGEPICQSATFLELAREIKQRGLDIVIFTGYTYEQLMRHAGGEESPKERAVECASNESVAIEDDPLKSLELQQPQVLKELLGLTDILIEGPFVLAQRDLTLKFRGSRNQRIIDMNKTRQAGEVVLLED